MVREELNFIEFQKQFHNEESCREQICKIKWPNGFKCEKCHHKEFYFVTTRNLYTCKKCHYQASATVGTIFHRSKISLNVWFSLIFLMLREKHGISTLSAQRLLGIRCYRTAWTMAQKIRKVFADKDQQYKLSGVIEVDECLIGGKKKGKRGRGAEGRTLVLVAAEKIVYKKNGEKRIKTGYCKAQPIPSADAQSLTDALKGKIAMSSIVETDGWKAYQKLGLKHFSHKRTVQGSGENASKLFPCVHRIISNLKGNIRGTFHGIKPKYLQYYLGEFLYRYNRKKTEAQLFFRGLWACVEHKPYTFSELIA